MSTQADTSGVLSFLWDKLDKKVATDEELDFITQAAEESQCMARTLSDTVSAVGCIIAEAQAAGREKGPLQHRELPSFLFSISDSLKTIAELSFIAREASFHLRERSEQRICAKAKTAADAAVHSAPCVQRKECALDQV